MRIIDLVPYERNARDNDRAVPGVAESIREFGFRGQIVLNRETEGGTPEHPVIVNGHTRVKALQSLGYDEIPDEWVTYCDGLSEEEAKALRLADNRTAEAATWNRALLQREVRAIGGIDMSRFGFDFRSRAAGFARSQERLRTDHAYNLHLVARDACGTDGMPLLDPADARPDELMGFNYAKTADADAKARSGCHFFIDDYQFERVWAHPERYDDLLRGFACVLGPDFSLYADMPRPMQEWNLYRSRALCRHWQDEGMCVVPTLSWSQPETYAPAFGGMPAGGTVATSSVGVMRDEAALAAWRDGMAEALRVVRPSRVLLYGADVPGFDWGGVEVVRYGARRFKKGA